jgi:hypothetical protein
MITQDRNYTRISHYTQSYPYIEFAQVGDSIVKKARETLERAIALVQDTPQWGAKVVYGDTDRLDYSSLNH